MAVHADPLPHHTVCVLEGGAVGPLWLQWADWPCGAGGGGDFRKLVPHSCGGAKLGEGASL